MIQIEKGIKITPRSKYPFQAMEVGDSFAVPYTLATHYGLYGIAKRFGIKVALRRISDTTLRCWRIK